MKTIETGKMGWRWSVRFGVQTLMGGGRVTNMNKNPIIPTLHRLPCLFGINYSGCQSSPSFIPYLMIIMSPKNDFVMTVSTAVNRK